MDINIKAYCKQTRYEKHTNLVFLFLTEAFVWRCSKMITPLPESLFLIKLQTSVRNTIKKRFWNRGFPVNLLKFLKVFYRTPPVAASALSYEEVAITVVRRRSVNNLFLKTS